MSGSAWRNVALAASLLLNVFIVGVAVGGKAAGLHVAGPWAHGPEERSLWAREFSPRLFVMALPPEHRRDITRRIMQEGRGSRALMQEAREAGAAALEELTADDFDPDAALAALNAAREAQLRVERRGQEIMIQIMAELPDDVRLEALEEAQQIESRGSHGGPGRGHRRGGD